MHPSTPPPSSSPPPHPPLPLPPSSSSSSSSSSPSPPPSSLSFTHSSTKSCTKNKHDVCIMHVGLSLSCHQQPHSFTGSDLSYPRSYRRNTYGMYHRSMITPPLCYPTLFLSYPLVPFPLLPYPLLPSSCPHVLYLLVHSINPLFPHPSILPYPYPCHRCASVTNPISTPLWLPTSHSK